MERRSPIATRLPAKPNLRYLQEQAKDLLKLHRQSNAAVCAVLRLHHRFTQIPDPDILAARVSLQEVQHALALDYGLKDWHALKAHVQRLSATSAKSHIAINVYNELSEKGNKRADRIAALAIEDDMLLERVLEAAASQTKRVKNSAAKALKIISATSPATLYPSIDFFAELLFSQDNILKWIAADVLGNLAYVDT